MKFTSIEESNNFGVSNNPTAANKPKLLEQVRPACGRQDSSTQKLL